MLHQLLNLKRPLIVFDTETTGLNTNEDRIVEFGFEVWGPSGLEKEWRSLVNPERSIPEHVSKTHGIYDIDIQRCQACKNVRNATDGDPCTCEQPKIVPTFKQLAPSIARGFTNCDFGGKNVRFDLRITAAEMDRAGVPWSYMGARVVDIDRLEQIAEPRHLSNLYEKYTGKKAEGAHQALNDVKMSTEVIVEQLRKHQTLPRDLDVLHAAQWPGWIDPEGKFKFIDGVPCFGGWGKFGNQPMRNADPGYWDWILKSNFSADVKTLASDARVGKFPQCK